MFESDMDKDFNGCIPLNYIPPFIIKSSLENTLSISQNLRRLCSSDLISLAYPHRNICYFESLLHSLPYNFSKSPNGGIGIGDIICKRIHRNNPNTPSTSDGSQSPYGDIGNGGNSILPTFLTNVFSYYPNISKLLQSPHSSETDTGHIGDKLSTCFKIFNHLNAQHPIPYECFFLHNFFGWVNNTQNNTKSVTFTSPTKIFCGVNN